MGVGGDQERATRTHIYIYIFIFVYIQFLGLGPVNLPPGMCVVRLSLCGKPARYVAIVIPACKVKSLCFWKTFSEWHELTFCHSLRTLHHIAPHPFSASSLPFFCRLTSAGLLPVRWLPPWLETTFGSWRCFAAQVFGGPRTWWRSWRSSQGSFWPKMRRKVGDVDFTGDTCRWFPLILWKKTSVYMGILRVFFANTWIDRGDILSGFREPKAFCQQSSSVKSSTFFTSISEPYSKGTCIYIYTDRYDHI